MLSFSSPEIDRFWAKACSHLGIEVDSPYHACPFAEPNGDPAIDAIIDGIADLAWLGMKRGTAHLDMQFDRDGVARREIGDHWVALTSSGSPVCVVAVIDINLVPFRDVGPVFAASEGEGDLSLEFWRNGHREYFQEQCERWGLEWDESYPVCCESLIPVYCPEREQAPGIRLPHELLRIGTQQ